MNDDLLQAIVALEKAIQQELDEEQGRAASWLARQQDLQKDRLAAAREQIEEQSLRRQLAVENRLSQRLSLWEASERERLERYRCFAEAQLPKRIEAMIRTLLPGGGHDHRDVEG